MGINPLFLPAYWFVCISTHNHTYLSIHPSIHLSIYPSIYPADHIHASSTRPCPFHSPDTVSLIQRIKLITKRPSQRKGKKRKKNQPPKSGAKPLVFGMRFSSGSNIMGQNKSCISEARLVGQGVGRIRGFPRRIGSCLVAAS